MHLPWQILEWFSRLRSLPRSREASRHRLRISCSESHEAILSFGGVLGRGGVIHGGAVKLLALQSALACSEEKFNVLYLVSSAQPEFPVELVSICKDRGIKFVWNQNGVGYPAWAGPAPELHNAPMRRLRAASDFIIYQSEFCKSSANRFLGPCAAPSKTLLNPVDLMRFSPPIFPNPRTPLRLLAMGTQNYPARVNHVIDSLSELRRGGVDATLTIAGRLLWKDAESDVAGHAAGCGVERFVFRVGEFTQDMAVSLYRSHHVLIHPKYMDPCPTVVAEALACGLPVVASLSGGLPEMTSASCARLIPVAEDWNAMHTPSGQEIAESIADLLPNLAAASLAAREFAIANFDSKAWILSHKRIFQTLLHGSTAS